MVRINSNISAVNAAFQLSRSHRDLARSLERLSSGLRINRGADNPAGLIVSERLRSEISAMKQAVNNSQRAINVIATTEGALNEVSALLIDIQGLLVEAANSGAFSDEEIDANQLQIDSAIDSISRIANTTTFAGRKLLDGSLDYFTSGVNTTLLANVSILAANFGSRDFLPVQVNVAASGLQAELHFEASAIGNQAISIDLHGTEGIISLTFPASASTNTMVEQINAISDATGILASANAYTAGGAVASGVVFLSQDYGSDAFVSVTVLDGSAPFFLEDRDGIIVNPNTGGGRRVGRDAVATVNGIATVGDGLKLSVTSSLLSLEVLLDTTFGAQQTEFAITGGGSLFQLGPRVNTNQQVNIGVKSMQANKLGNRLVGFLSELTSGGPNSLRSANFAAASRILDEAITQVSVLRGRLGAFERNKLQPNINQLQITTENLISAESVIRDTDFAVETSELTRAQILVQAGTSILTIANANQQNVLSLLGG
ncbi:MAG: flagellin [Planctomycetes bacterium]|nr:flagellin [Planctomycetota bacterium]